MNHMRCILDPATGKWQSSTWEKKAKEDYQKYFLGLHRDLDWPAFSSSSIYNVDLSHAVQIVHDEAVKKQGPATRDQYVGPWEDICIAWPGEGMPRPVAVGEPDFWFSFDEDDVHRRNLSVGARTENIAAVRSDDSRLASGVWVR